MSGGNYSPCQSMRMIAYTRQKELIEHLPRPGKRWAWTECELSPSTKHKLKGKREGGGVIRKCAETGLWYTHPGFAEYVEENHGELQSSTGIDYDARLITDWRGEVDENG